MLKIGLTGGMGSGKTTVAKIFEVLGIPVLYADDVAKTVMHTNAALKQRIIELFGGDAYINDALNRPHIANIVFNDQYKLEQLNALVHPVTLAAADIWMQAQKAAYVIKEAALMFEAGAAASLDYVIGVSAPQAVRVQRVMQRDNTSRGQVLARMNNQLDETIKMKLCDFVIINDEQQAVLPQVLKLHQHFLQLQAKSKGKWPSS